MVGFVGGCAPQPGTRTNATFSTWALATAASTLCHLWKVPPGVVGWMDGTVNHPISSSGNSDCQNRMFWAQGFFHEFSESQDFFRCIKCTERLKVPVTWLVTSGCRGLQQWKEGIRQWEDEVYQQSPLPRFGVPLEAQHHPSSDQNPGYFLERNAIRVLSVAHLQSRWICLDIKIPWWTWCFFEVHCSCVLCRDA